MTYKKTIICLANSWKLSSRCVAGKVVIPQNFGEWVRPMGSGEHGAITIEDRRYEPGGDPALLDVIEITMSSKAPHPFQAENHNIDAKFYWKLIRKGSPSELANFLDPIQTDLWGDHGSSGSGIKDRVPEAIAPIFGYSLRLIEVLDLKIQVSVENPTYNLKKAARGYFTYSGNTYAWKITDPKTQSTYISMAEGTYHVGKAILCVSLSEPFNGYAYKLIAGVF